MALANGLVNLHGLSGFRNGVRLYNNPRPFLDLLTPNKESREGVGPAD